MERLLIRQGEGKFTFQAESNSEKFGLHYFRHEQVNKTRKYFDIYGSVYLIKFLDFHFVCLHYFL